MKSLKTSMANSKSLGTNLKVLEKCNANLQILKLYGSIWKIQWQVGRNTGTDMQITDKGVNLSIGIKRTSIKKELSITAKAIEISTTTFQRWVDDLVVNVLGDSKNSSVEKDSSSLVNQENNFEGKDSTQKKQFRQIWIV